MRVTSDRQTLILAGESPPPRRSVIGNASGSDDTESPSAGQTSSRVTIISARVDAIVTQGLYTPRPKAPVAAAANAALDDLTDTNTASAALEDSSSLPTVAPQVHQAHVISNRASSASYAANAYARTRDLAARVPAIIDTYA